MIDDVVFANNCKLIRSEWKVRRLHSFAIVFRQTVKLGITPMLYVLFKVTLIPRCFHIVNQILVKYFSSLDVVLCAGVSFRYRIP